jgi:alpha-D-ribose 1-methylphosphonate 5-triphosphate synthase subunit PhnG
MSDDHVIDRTQNASAARRGAMAVLASAPAADIESRLAAANIDVAFKELRPVETGLVMLRGRIGGDGAPFNLGEATVTRAAIALDTGERGFAYVLGRDPRKARLAAVCDALWQSPRNRQRIENDVIAPLKHAQDEARAKKRAQTAATRVDFFTLVRGED